MPKQDSKENLKKKDKYPRMQNKNSKNEFSLSTPVGRYLFYEKPVTNNSMPIGYLWVTFLWYLQMDVYFVDSRTSTFGAPR